MGKGSHFIGGVLLVSGTAMGAGMLALPISTELAGFYPSLFLLLFFWAYMTFTAFLLLEVNLWMDKKNTHLVCMAKKTLGLGGEIVSCAAYIFLLYALTTAYMAGSSLIVLDALEYLAGSAFPLWIGSLPLLLIFGYSVYRGCRSADLLGRVLMTGLLLAYGCFVVYLSPPVEHGKLVEIEWPSLATAISITAASFGFHLVIPTLTKYLDRDIPLLKGSLFVGSLVPLGVYVAWEYLTLGSIPLEGPHTPGNPFLTVISNELAPAIPTLARTFTLFAIVTSFLGVSLYLTDFLSERLNLKNMSTGKSLVFILGSVPPVLVTLLNPRAFFAALEYAGAFGFLVLLGLLPALMVWSGRYSLHYYSSYRAPGGKLSLVATIIISLSMIFVEMANQWNLFTIP